MEVWGFNVEVHLVPKHLSPLQTILVLEVAFSEPTLVLMIFLLTCVAKAKVVDEVV